MQLSEKPKRVIRDTAREIFDPAVRVRLFDSRPDKRRNLAETAGSRVENLNLHDCVTARMGISRELATLDTNS